MFGPNSNGAFFVEPGSNAIDVTTTEGTANNGASFMASRVSALYGAAETVQTSAIKALVLIRSY